MGKGVKCVAAALSALVHGSSAAVPQDCDALTTVWYAVTSTCKPCGSVNTLCCSTGGGVDACPHGTGLTCALRADPNANLPGASGLYGLAYVCVPSDPVRPSQASVPVPRLASNDSAVSDQSSTRNNGPRRVHKKTGLMQWLDSPPAAVPGAQYWPMQFDRMLGLSYFFYEQQRMGPLPPDTRAPWRADSLKKEGGGWLDGDVFKGGSADAGDFLKFMLPGAYSTARLAWLTHRFGAALRRTHFDGKSNWMWARRAVKWNADFMVRAVEDNRVLLHQGDIEADHGYIGLSELYPQFDRDPVWCDFGMCSDVSGEIAAALAHSALAFIDRKRLSQTYWERAKVAYAQTNVGQDTFGNSNDVFPPLAVYYTSSGVVSHVLFAAASMYTACLRLGGCSDEEAEVYKSDAERLGSMKEPDGNSKWFWPVSGWDNAYFDAAVLMAHAGVEGPNVFGQPAFKYFLADFVNKWVEGTEPVTISPHGQRWVTPWASLRYSLNGAATLLLWAALDEGMQDAASVNHQQARCAAVRQILYAGGLNDRGSFVAGFGDNPVQRNHHRSSVCAPWEQNKSSDNTCSMFFTDVVDPRGTCPVFEDEGKGVCYQSANRPNKFQTAGALVGGPKSASDSGDASRSPYSEEGWNDWRTDYIGSEQALDYNAGFSLALAAAIDLPAEFWTGGCEGVDDISDVLGQAQADKPHIEERYSDDDVYTFADFEEYGYTRSLPQTWYFKSALRY